MNLAICQYDYFEMVNPNLKLIEDNYGNLKIIDHSSITELPFTDIIHKEIFNNPPIKLNEDSYLKKI